MTQISKSQQNYTINGGLSSKTFLRTFQECIFEASKTSESIVFQTIITPDDARKILEKNTSNRPLNLRRVEGLVDVLRKNLWALNGDAIRLAKDGTLLDGQHRLQAVVNSDISIRTVVFLNAEYDIFKTIDIGKKRSTGDVVAVAFKDCKYPRNIAAAARTYLSYQNWCNGGSQIGLQTNGRNSSVMTIRNSTENTTKEKLTNEMILNFVSQNPNFIDFIAICSKLHSVQKPTKIDFHVFAALKWHTDQIDFDLSEKFWNKVVFGHKNTEDKNDSITKLTVYLEKTRQSGHELLVTSTLRHFSTIAYVWNLLRTKKTVQALPSSFEKLVLFK